MYSIPSYCELGSCSSSGNFLQGVVLSSSRTTTTTNMGNSSSSTAQKKAEIASKNHSEAERRRRKRINAHLATLRTLLPKTIKTDKASLLAGVVRRVRELKKTTSEFLANDGNNGTSQSNLFPTECDELNLCHSDTESGTIKATLCCEDRPGLISEINAAVKAAEGKVVRAEMSTVGGRTKSILWVQLVSPAGFGGGEGRLRRGLKGVVDRAAALSGTGPGLMALPENKRARLSQY